MRQFATNHREYHQKVYRGYNEGKWLQTFSMQLCKWLPGIQESVWWYLQEQVWYRSFHECVERYVCLKLPYTLYMIMGVSSEGCVQILW